MFSNKTFLSKSSILGTGILVFTIPAYADDGECPAGLPPIEEGVLETIEFSGDNSRTLQSTLSMLQKSHYEDIVIDDHFSELWLEEYLSFLDPSKSFLLQSDVDLFYEKYSRELDDLAADGSLEAASEIYLTYRNRAQEQINITLGNLENPEFVFDYASEVELPTDRDDYQWPSDLEDARTKSEQRLTLLMLNLKLSEKDEQDSRDQLIRRYQGQMASLRQQKTQQVLDLYLNALGHVYDPHTDYFSPRDSENFEINMSLSLEGIGAVLQSEDEFTKVVSVVPGGPAQLQGELKTADRIVSIGEGEDCEFIDIVGWRLDEVVDRIRGPKGTTVRLQVIPADEDVYTEERKIVRIVRDRVKLEDNAAKGEVIEVESQGEQYSLGVIDIPSFYLDINAMRNRDEDYRSTTRDTRAILDDFLAQGVDGVIVDLRQNGGGSLLEAATLTDLFVDPGPVVQIRDQNDRIYRNHRARSKAYYDGPLVVLIDRLSASASEIFAGAIQDYNRGLIIGSQSFGKGTVQSVQALPSGQLKLTESKFYRISGDSTQHKGVIPDIELPGLFNPLDIGESSYENALGWDQIRGIPHSRYDGYQEYLSPLMESHRGRLQSDADLQYLLGTIEIAEERRALKTVSLNEQDRIAERELWEAREDELIEQWRIALNLTDDGSESVVEIDLLETDIQPAGSSADLELAGIDATFDTGDTGASEEMEEPEPDLAEALLMEAGRIFADFLRMANSRDSELASIEN